MLHKHPNGRRPLFGTSARTAVSSGVAADGARQDGSVLIGASAQPIPARRGLVHRPAQACDVPGSTASISQPAKAVWTSSCEAPPTSDRHRLGPKLSSSTVAPGLASAETPSPWDKHCPASRPWKQPMSRKKSNVPRRGRQLRHVADDVAEPGRAPVLGCCRLDRGRHVVDAHGLPPPARELGGVLAAAAAEVERTAEGAGALALLAIQQRGDTRCRRRCVAFPGCDPESVHAGVVRHGLTSWRRQSR